MGGEGNREKEKRQVVRGFIVQSKSVERIKGELAGITDYRHLFLTKTLWAEKNAQSEQSAGQLTPIGGKVDKGEQVHKAMVREMLEETHLRPVQVEPLDHMLSYALQNRGKNVSVEQKLFVIDILPSDRAYPLDPEEDKLEVFHGLDLRELGELFGKGEILINKKKLSLLGNLRLSGYGADDTSIVIGDENKDVPIEIFQELSEKLFAKEIKKRRQVIKYLFQSLAFQEHEIKEWNTKFDQAKNFFEHQNIWKELMSSLFEYPEFQKHFFAAMDFANFEEETKQDLPHESQVEAIIRFTYTLLNTRYDFDAYLEIAEQNPKLQDFVTKIKTFIDTLTNETKETGTLQNRFAKKLESLSGLDDELVSHAFCQAFGISESSVPQKLDRISKFFVNLVGEGINPHVGKMYQKSLVTEITDIANSQLGNLLKYAFALRDPQWGMRVGERGDAGSLLMKKRIVFEARRKVALMTVFAKIDEWYADLISKGNQEIEKLTEDMWSFPQVDAGLFFISENGELKNVVVNPDDFDALSNVLSRQETKFRKFYSTPESTSFLIGNEVRTKQLDSVYRKIIVRGTGNPDEIKDLYGRAITIVEDKTDPASSKYVRTRDTRNIMIEGQVKEVTDMAPILDILERYANKPGVRILEYKPTPAPGEGMKSKGVGGGGSVRLAKFYIEHTDGKGVVRHEEVQIFSPSEDGRSAFYWSENKKEDDKRYFLDRMLDTRGLRSFIELMFPTSIYGGPIHAMVGDQQKKKKGNGSKSQK